MEIVYVGADDARLIAATGQLAVRGEPVDVPEGVATSLLEQADQWAATGTELTNEESE